MVTSSRRCSRRRNRRRHSESARERYNAARGSWASPRSLDHGSKAEDSAFPMSCSIRCSEGFHHPSFPVLDPQHFRPPRAACCIPGMDSETLLQSNHFVGRLLSVDGCTHHAFLPSSTCCPPSGNVCRIRHTHLRRLPRPLACGGRALSS